MSTTGSILLDNLSGGSGYILTTSGNIQSGNIQQQITLADGYTYTVSGTSLCLGLDLPNGITSPSNSIVFYMATGATVNLNFNNCTFNCPVTFNTLHIGESSIGGSGRTLNMYGTVTFNYHTIMNTYGSNINHTSVINFGTGGMGGNSLTMNLYNIDTNSGFDVLKVAGLGYYAINNISTIINCYLNPITGGLHQYSPTNNFTLNAGIIYAIIGSEFASELNLNLTTYMTMDPAYSLLFNYAISLEVTIPDNIPVIIATYGVEFTASIFKNFAVTVNDGASLLFDDCTFNSTGSNAITANLIGSGTMSLDTSNVINVSSGYKIMTLTGSSSNVNVTGNPTVNVPAGYSYSEPLSSLQNFNFVGYMVGFNTGNFTFGTFSVPLNFTLNGSGLTGNVSVTAQQGATLNIANNNQINLVNSSFTASSENGNNALNVNYSGSSNVSVNCGANSSDYVLFYAGDGMNFFSSSLTITNYFRCYLNADNDLTGTWNFDNTTNISVLNNNVFLNTQNGTYTINLTNITAGTFTIDASNTTAQYGYADAHNVTTVTIGGTNVGSQQKLSLQYVTNCTLIGVYGDSSTFQTPLIIDEGTINAGTGLEFNMQNAGTWPYSFTLNNPANAVIYLTQGPSYNFSYSANSTRSWYLSPIYLITDNNSNNNVYSISHINSSGITFCDYQTNVAHVTLSQVTYQVTFDITNAMTLVDSTLSNSGQNGYAVLNLTGSGILTFSSPIVLNCYSYGTCSASSKLHAGDCNVTVNYYYTSGHNTFNFGVLGGEFSLEYERGVHLMSDHSSGSYALTSTASTLTTFVSGTVSPKIASCSFGAGLLIDTTSSETTYLEDVTMYINDDGCQLQIIGSGTVAFDSSSHPVTVNIVNPSSGTITVDSPICVGLYGNGGTAYLTMSNGAYSVTTSGGSGTLSYRYGILTYSTSVLNIANNSLGSPSNLAVYWPTLASTFSANPFISSNASNYVAVDYDYTQSSYSITHSSSGYNNYYDGTITSKNITFASGNVSTSATSVSVTLTPETLCFPTVGPNALVDPNISAGNIYTGDLGTLFTSGVFASKYYGALGTSNTESISVTNSTRKQTVTINFATCSNVYLGNCTFSVTLTANNADFGTIETFPYAINDNVTYPTLCTCPTSISVYEDNSTNPRIRFSVDTPFALPLYVYATQDTSNSNLYIDAAKLLTYLSYDDGTTYLTYDDYINTSTNSGKVQVWDAGSSNVYEHVHYGDYSEYYQTGAQTDFQFFAMPDASDTYPIFTSSLISIVNNTTDYLYPIVSLDSGDVSSGYDQNTTLYTSDEAPVGTYNAGSTPTVSYTITYYVQMLTKTVSGNHSLLITGTTDGFIYTFSGSNVTDNGTDGGITKGTASLSYTGTDNTLQAVTMTVTTTNALNTYGFGTAGVQDIQFTIIDQAYEGLAGYAGNLTATTQYADTYFSFPAVVALSIDNTNFNTSGTLTKDFSKGTGYYYIYMSTCGTVAEDLAYTINVTYGAADKNFTASSYDASISGYLDPVTNPSSITGIIRAGYSTSNIQLAFPQNNIISGSDNGIYTFVPDGITIGLVEVTLSSQVSDIYFNDVSSVHEVTFSYGIGGEVATSSATVSGVSTNGGSTPVTVQQPPYFSIPSISNSYPTNVDLFMNLGVQFNSIPYNTMSGNDDTVVINYSFYGSNTSTTDFTTQLFPGSTIYVYNNTTYSGSSNINAVQINSSTYTDNNTLYIVQGSTQYTYIMIRYYASKTDSSNLTSCYDYYNLPTSSSPVTIATYDYSAAQTGTIGARYVSIGNYRLASDGVGDALITFLGNVQSDSSPAVGTSYVLPLKTDSTNDYILTSIVTPVEIVSGNNVTALFNQSTCNGPQGNNIDLNYACIVYQSIPFPDNNGLDGLNTLFPIASLTDPTKCPANTINTTMTVTYAMVYGKKGVFYSSVPIVIQTDGQICIPRRLMYGGLNDYNNDELEHDVYSGWSPYNEVGTIMAFSVHYNNKSAVSVNTCTLQEYSGDGTITDFPVNIRWIGGSSHRTNAQGSWSNQVADPSFTKNGIANLNNGLHNMPVYKDANGRIKVFSSNNYVYNHGQPAIGAKANVAKPPSNGKQTAQTIINALKNNPDLMAQLKALL